MAAGGQKRQGTYGEVVSAIDWKSLISKAARPENVVAHTYRNKKWSSASRPVVVACNDGRDYVVKGRQNGRMIFNDQVVGRLGILLKAPVANVAIVEIPQDLVSNNSDMRHVPSGTAHGSQIHAECTDRQWLQHPQTSDPENRERFAQLAILYGLVGANDHQVIYEIQKPQRVWSVDHGHFFHGPEWTAQSLRSKSAAGQPYKSIVDALKISYAELITAASMLEVLSPERIASCIAAPPDEWSVPIEERALIAEFVFDGVNATRKHLHLA